MAKGKPMDEFGLGLDEENVEASAPAAVAPKKRKMYTIFVDEEENQLNYVFVGVNGKGYQIPRGIDVEVPEEVIEVLKNAQATRLVQTTNPVTGLIDSREQTFSRIPYRIVRM